MQPDHLDLIYDVIRDVPDFPEPGIVFKDITPLLLDAPLFRQALESMIAPWRGDEIDRILAVESRGFIFGAAMAREIGAGLVLARKVGKLPWKSRKIDYSLEYGADAIEVHLDALDEGHRVLIVDDVLATGGTAHAAAQAVLQAGSSLAGFSFLIELTDLGGREKLPEAHVASLLSYPRCR